MPGQRMNLTPRQSEIVEFIRSYSGVHRVAPTNAEIGAWCGITRQGVAKHLDRLVALGVLSRVSGGGRVIRLEE